MKRLGIFLKKNAWTFYLTATVAYSETILKLWCFKSIGFKGFLLTMLLSVVAGSLFTLLCTIRPGGFFRAATAVVLAALFLLYGAQAVYFRIFKGFLLLSYTNEAGMVLEDFWREALTGIGRAAPVLLALAFPLALWLILGKKLTPKAVRAYTRLRFAAVFALMELSASLLISSSNSGIRSVNYLYHDAFVPEMSVRYFGALTMFEQDLIYNFTGGNTEAVLASPVAAQTESPRRPLPVRRRRTQAPTQTPGPTYDTSPNVTEIDWNALMQNTSDATLQQMDKYFASVVPTDKNQYTGIFKGYNLIWICAEGFCRYCLDKEHLPTLWKLSHEGFVFNNYYNPYWYFSTADGEYTLQNSLIPISGDKSVYTAMHNTLPYGMGNALNPLGYASYAFHDHTSIYYSRNVSLPNLGYKFYAKDTGLTIGDTWPESDVDMINSSVGYYLDKEPFNVYYMTVSGHMNYSFSGNAMAAKHKAEVQDLPYSDDAKAYVASEMETDQAIAKLIDYLKQAGVLDHTVIVLSGDHYPYDLDPEFTSGATGLAELMGGSIDPLEKYHSTLIVWNSAFAAQHTQQVNTLCCQMDVLPTLLNLFGVQYDSRLLMGRDIFAEGPRTVVFRDRSYITDYGRYIASTDTFTPAEGMFSSETDSTNYAVSELNTVDTMFDMSADILHYNYYSVVFHHND